MRAKAVVITFADTHASERIIDVVRQLRSDLPVIVRTIDDSDIEQLRHAGADEVVSEVMEGSLMLASHALVVLGVPLGRVLRRIRTVREERYNLFKGFFRGASDEVDGIDDSQMSRLHSVQLVPGAHAIGLPIGALRLSEHRVEVKAVRRGHARYTELTPDFELYEGDVLVLLARPQQLLQAETLLLQG